MCFMEAIMNISSIRVSVALAVFISLLGFTGAAVAVPTGGLAKPHVGKAVVHKVHRRWRRRHYRRRYYRRHGRRYYRRRSYRRRYYPRYRRAYFGRRYYRPYYYPYYRRRYRRPHFSVYIRF